MVRWAVAGVLATYMLAVFQSTVGGGIQIHGVPPDFLFVWTVCIGLLSGRHVGALTGFGAGVVEGALAGKLTTAFAISKLMTGFAAGMLTTKMLKEHWLVLVLIGGLLSLVNDTLFLALSRTVPWRQAGHLIGMRMLCHGVLTPLAFVLVSRARRALGGQRGAPG